MYAPTVHLGGTSYQELYNQHMHALRAVSEALTIVRNTCPNRRDYVRLNGGYEDAVASHLYRLGLLQKVQRQLNELVESICRQRGRDEVGN